MRTIRHTPMEVPSSKLQTPDKLQLANANSPLRPARENGARRRRRFWHWGFGLSLELGAWSLELGASQRTAWRTLNSVSSKAGISASGIMFGPSLNARSGSDR